MTTRSDVTVDYIDSPRIIEVNAPSTEMTMQDLVDTGRILEHEFKGMSYDHLLDASGKQDLGGGTQVGITVALQDAKLAFEARITPAQIGAVTGSPSTPVFGRQVLQDTGALFISNDVVRGSLIVNFTDNSVAEVVSTDSETQITAKTLVNGTTNTYTNSDIYHIFNVVQVSATGGNLTAIDENGAPVSPILATAFTQVILTSSSSATLQDSDALQASSYNKNLTVSWDPTNGTTGILFPQGTKEAPALDLSDVLTICINRGIPDISIIGNATLDSGDDITGYKINGEGANRTTLTINPLAIAANSEIFNTHLIGTLDGNAIVRDCSIGDLNYISGFMHQCAFTGTMVLQSGVTCHSLSCYSGIVGDGTPIFDCANSGSLALRDYSGGIRIESVTGGQSLSIDMSSGRVKIDLTTCINGKIICRGVAKVMDTNNNHLGSGFYNTNLEIVNECVYGEHLHDVWTDMGLNPDVASSEIQAKQIEDKVLDANLTDHVTVGTFGYFIQKKLLTVAKFLGLK